MKKLNISIVISAEDERFMHEVLAQRESSSWEEAEAQIAKLKHFIEGNKHCLKCGYCGGRDCDNCEYCGTAGPEGEKQTSF